jgi:hypothetical protein
MIGISMVKSENFDIVSRQEGIPVNIAPAAQALAPILQPGDSEHQRFLTFGTLIQNQ